jgi:epoxyqueuosine reductase
MNTEKIVLMSCCAPCATSAIRKMKSENRDFIVLFFNPNIFPESEYLIRMNEQIKFCEELDVKYAIGDYDHASWLCNIQGLENEPERGARCAKCFHHRFLFGAKWAKDNGYNIITSVFGVSNHKDQNQVNLAAQNLGIKYVDFGFDYNPDANMYRQKYCGCEFSETYHGKA